MLSSRKALMSNLNYVHLQHVSLGVHLSMRPELKETPAGQDTGLKDVTGCCHQWKDTSDTILVDANSNDPSVPCQCCDQHSGHEDSLQYSSNENLEAIMCDDYLSPDELPISPLSPSSPSTDSSSSSDFTLDDSPVSMYYREYAEDALDTPDQQPNIIPLDVELQEAVTSALDDSLYPSCPTANTLLHSQLSQSHSPENALNNNNIDPTDVPFIDWSSETILDSNCNSLVDPEQPQLPPSSSTLIESNRAVGPEPQTSTVDRQDIANANHVDFPLWSVDEEILPGLPVLEDSSTLTPKKTITSFHELAQKRRRSGMQLPLQSKRDKSDWLIVFSPDTEQPPINELTTSAFYHGGLLPQAQPLPEGKEVTTFRELRYRNTIYKQNGQQAKGHNITSKGHQNSAEGVSAAVEVHNHHVMEEPNNSSPSIADKENIQDMTTRDGGKPERPPRGQARKLQRPDLKTHQLNAPEVPQRLSSQNDHRPPGLADALSAMTGRIGQHRPFTLQNNACGGKKENSKTEIQARVRRRGMADGGDRRGLEGTDDKKYMADGPPRGALPDKKHLLIAIGNAVDRIIGHFNGSRNQVQKAQLGDSRLSPKLGYLILNGLCPPLYTLLGDGLKPFQKDLIIGRRRLTPWSLVEASTRAGPRSLQLLYCSVSRLQQLRDPQRRFNAFIFALLNTKQLDIWVSHLHQSYDELSPFYHPAGFLPMAATTHPGLREELLLILQPLSALTFHADLLFEHHHLLLQDPPTPPAAQTMSDSWGAPSVQHLLYLVGWLANNLTGSNDRGTAKTTHSQSQSSTWDIVSSQPDSKDRPEDSPSHACSDLGSSSGPAGAEPSPTSKTKDCSSTWWSHLSQASHIYIPARKASFKKLPGWGAAEPGDRSDPSQQSPETQRESAEQRLRETPSCDSHGNELPKPHIGDPASGGTGFAPAPGDNTPTPKEKGRWLGQLFGANLAQSQDTEAKAIKSRRPSSWLPPNVSVLTLIRKISAPERAELLPEEAKPQQENVSKPERSLRALCDHAPAAGNAQLSFRKGDVLQLLDTVDEDWIRCRRGSDTGLVPVGYTSLIL